MCSIKLDERDISSNIANWKVWSNKQNELMFTITYLSGKKYIADSSRVEISPQEELKGDLLFDKKKNTVAKIETAKCIGNQYIVYTYQGSEKMYVRRVEFAEIVAGIDVLNHPVIKYFETIAKKRWECAIGKSNNTEKIEESIFKQFQKLTGYDETALTAYLTGKAQKRKRPENLIFPFGINESQLTAVERAFSAQVSIIQGPPGTGKTQTILNIIANILLQNKTVAVVSNNNDAVKNVYEKLSVDKMGEDRLDCLIAKLGNSKNRKKFFVHTANNPDYDNVEYPITERVTPEDVSAVLEKIRKLLKDKNELALLRSALSEAEVEHRKLKDLEKAPISQALVVKKQKWSCDKLVQIICKISDLPDANIPITAKLGLLLRFGIWDKKLMDNLIYRTDAVFGFQSIFYEKLIADLKQKIKLVEQTLATHNYDDLLKALIGQSKECLKDHLNHQYRPSHRAFDEENYSKNISDFLRRFPIVGSGSHSIVNSLGSGTIIDYLIIDEASQQDIVPGFLGLGCARNVIVVGDQAQLAHIYTPMGIECPNELYDCEKHSLLESFSLVFQDAAPVTLLKEHYRCDHKIIQFCNQQFYNNQLISMGKSMYTDPLKLIVTAKGNHVRNNANIRELESLVASGLMETQQGQVGFVTPYVNQKIAAKEYLPEEYVRDTVHKFQGRECTEMIFSTVLDKKNDSKFKLKFVDDERLVNVAVSRAIGRFILVTGNEVFEKNNRSIAALIRYMKYYADPEDIIESNVVSAFDLLYAEYDKSLNKLKKSLRKEDSKFVSEQIMAAMLRNILNRESFEILNFHREIYLNKLVSGSIEFSNEEMEFMRHGARCDFVLYYKVGKEPFMVIEVDGAHHDKLEQQKRDQLKNNILKKAGIPIYRARTHVRIDEEKLQQIISSVAENLSAQPSRQEL